MLGWFANAMMAMHDFDARTAPTPGPDARAPEETMRLVLGSLTNAVGVLLDLPIGNRYEEEALAQLKREWTRADAFLCGARAPSDSGLRRAAEALLATWDDPGPGTLGEKMDALRSALSGAPAAKVEGLRERVEALADEWWRDSVRLREGNTIRANTSHEHSMALRRALARAEGPPATYRESEVGAAVHRGVEAAARVLAGQGIDTRGKLDLSGEVKDEIAQILAARAEGPREPTTNEETPK